MWAPGCWEAGLPAEPLMVYMWIYVLKCTGCLTIDLSPKEPHRKIYWVSNSDLLSKVQLVMFYITFSLTH